MYSPQQSIQSYAKTVPQQSGFPWRLLLLSIVILFLTIFIYLGMTLGFKPYLETKISEADAQLKQITASLQTENNDVFEIYSQLFNIKDLSSKHLYSSRLFTLFEQGTLPSVTLNKTTADMVKQVVSVQGIAPDYDTTVQQVAAYGNLSGVSQAQLTSSMRNENGTVTFFIDISLSKGFFDQTAQ